MITITVSGPVGSGKSAIIGVIETAMRAHGVPVFHEDDQMKIEKNMTHAEWNEYLDLYKPAVVIVEEIDK